MNPDTSAWPSGEKIRQLSMLLIGFLLPGAAAGWFFAGSAVRLAGDPVISGAIFSAGALMGALAGRWLLRRNAWLGTGLLFFQLQSMIPPALLLLTAAAGFGIFAVRPMKRLSRKFFQFGVFAGAAAGFFSGGNILLHPTAMQAAAAAFIPAAAMLTGSILPEKPWRVKLLMFFAGLVLAFVMPWKPANLPQVNAQGDRFEYFRTRNGETRVRTAGHLYTLPRDLTRQEADLLTSALQPVKNRIRVLVIEEIPSSAAGQFKSFHWVQSADRICFASRQPDFRKLKRNLRKDPAKRYDLIFVQELPGKSSAGKTRFLQSAVRDLLAPDGVLVHPAGLRCEPENFQTAELPGSGGAMQLCAALNTELAVTFAELEIRLKNRSDTHHELLPEGLMTSLYDLRQAEPERSWDRSQPGKNFFNMVRQTAAGGGKAFALLFAAGILLTLFWFSRYPGYAENFAIAARGAGMMLGLTAILIAAEEFQLLLQLPTAAFFGTIALAVPHRNERIRKELLLAVLSAAAAGILLTCGPCKNISTVIPALLLLAPAFWTGSGNNGADSARYLHFLGLLAGIVLFALLPPETALPAALLLLWL